ncbi:hypothetical protein K431DRAFT_286514 [Polychaeton citri CBS 116435]|uniref:Uncharacterized protein n=1 Tax=Polychaeton citri CBS 116435 TaxID=1314669 RepID=A0A9P4Q352_9PEZI|nr:hypothetical protein K431DRAFT_286514 [Polychaeton citri CBS 116435]
MPLGLSASYKTFTGGQSYVPMKRSVDMPSSYGIFPPPGLTPLGSNQGTFIFANATIPFAQKAQHLAPDIRPTNLTYVLGKNVSDPPLPPFPQVYGFNMVLLSNQSTVFLDTPSDEYLKSIQASLAIDESVAISADVNGLVSAYNETVNAHPESLDQKLASFCATAHNQLIGVVDLYNRWTLMALEDMVNDTSVWLGFVPSDKAQTTCDGLGKFVNQYDNRRVKCQGTWQITRQSVFLTDGSCSDEALPDRMQAILKINLGISRWFMGPLTDLLADFSLARNESVWKAPSLATAVAGALWSRIAAGFSPAARSPWSLEPIMYGWNISDTEFVPWPETGAWYEVNDTAISIRPAMRRAASLYGVIVLQPLLSITFLILRCLCCSAPVSEGFGLISILAGVDHASLNALRGASYSGKLNRTTHVHIALEDGDDGRGKVRYHLSGDNVTKRNGKLHPGRLYE